jgi:hypothetical protein
MDRIEAIRKRLAALDDEKWKQKGHSVVCQRIAELEGGRV